MPLMPTPPNGAVRSRTRKRVDPDGAGADGAADPLGPLLRAGVDDRRQAVARWSWRARSPRPRRGRSGTSAPGRTPRAARPRSRCERGSISVGSYQRPPIVRPPAAAHDRVAVRARPLDEALDPGQVVGVDQRRDGGAVVARVAQHVRVGVAVERARGTRRGPTPRRAAACRPGTPARRRRTGRPPCAAAASRSASANTISGPLPPSSAVNGTMLRGRGHGRSGGPVSGEPVKLMRRTPGSATSAAPASSPMPWTTLKHAGREPGLGRQVGQQRARQRRPLGRLQDDGAAGGQRRRGLPGREHERRVPGRDHDGRAAGMRITRFAGAVRLPHALLVGRGQVGVGAEVARAAGDHARLQRALAASPCRGTRRWRCARRCASIRSASRCRWTARPGRPERGPRRGRRRAAARHRQVDRRSGRRGRPRRSAAGRSARSLERLGAATRSPPMKWSERDVMSATVLTSGTPSGPGRAR